MTATPTALADVQLLDRYRATDGRVLLSGVQALVRVAIDQRRADQAEGLDTAGFISGYPGSPLAGLDLELTRRADLLAELGVIHRPGTNEELAATAVAGSQLAMNQPDALNDGVFALWYGKAPGLDRASDALRHGNLMGAGPRGGVLVCVGDDPQAKSSSVPSTSEPTLYSLAMPILAPADPQEVLDLGRHGLALSRHSGLWVGVRIPATVADSTQSVEVGAQRIHPVAPDHTFEGAPFTHRVSAQLLGVKLIELEESLYGPRLEIARRYSTVNGLNRVTARGRDDVMGIVAAGPAYLAVLSALGRLGLGRDDLADAGVRLMKVSMPYPLDERLVREFALGLHEILVVEDKRAFLETLIKSALYGVDGSPPVVGKSDDQGRPLVPVTGEVDADGIAFLLATRLARLRDIDTVSRWLERERPATLAPLPLVRGAYFCSGCPHNTSVRVPRGAYVGSGSGCHGLAIQMDPRRVGTVVGRFQMGGEGAMWIGMSPFVGTPHFFQNLGDGTLAHSGSLAIRAAVASNVNITFKILVNSTVAMTGGQPIAGGHDVATLARQLLAEGVSKIIVTADEPRRERAKGLPRGVEVWPRRRIVEAQEVLARVSGVSVLLHDQECAAELRRKRKRGVITSPRERVHVNTRLCEDCGDCGAVSNCLSVRRVDTPFGPKTAIHQESCNLDFTCLEAECPALVTVRPRGPSSATNREPLIEPEDLQDPEPLVDAECFTVRLTGIGGTGVLTVAQIIAMAAHLEGSHVRELDQTGIAQKGGAVVSDLRISRLRLETAPRLGEGDCDLYLGCDALVAATTQYLAAATRTRTIAVASTSVVPTGRQVADRDVASVSFEDLRSRVDGRSQRNLNVWIDAPTIARDSLGSDNYANVVLLGAAFQRGAMALSGRAIERAIELNGVDVEANKRAFRLGRRVVASMVNGPMGVPPLAGRRAGAGGDVESGASRIEAGPGGPLEHLIRLRVEDLTRFQNRAYASRYALVVQGAREAEQRVAANEEDFSRAVAVELHRLMAYKDEYEVGGLHLLGDAHDEIERIFGAGSGVTYHLRPTWIGNWGRGRKIRLGAGARLGFRVLRAARFLRGTPLDPFGRSSQRREERAIRDEYIAVISQLSDSLTSENYVRATDLAGLPAMVRGFGSIKTSSMQRYRERMRSIIEVG